MSNTINRRRFLGTAGAVGATTLLASCAPAMSVPKPNLDGTIFNFALNLEYLEAAFYLAATGRLQELDAAGGDSSKVILPAGFTGRNGDGVKFASADVRAYANEIATDELAHVRVIRKVLGLSAVAQPTLDLGPAFVAAGKAASGGAIANFNPFANDLFFLHGAFVFEDVGVTAYKGAARLLSDDSAGGNLENAAGILAVEAYHAGMIRTLLYQQRDTQVTASLKVSDVVQAISNLRDSVDGPLDTDQGILDANGMANIVLADSNAIAYSRTPRQVGNIVFLGVNATKGGFFPDGLSGDFSKILAL
ncbi:ferritin-like domain-containing protein [Deinococcus taeanensis]|uniref:ferritin-like domain-containing protein n=1 Tax=Deinococcus taeanensis TaxID=2737050 RepID=UPI001CDB8C62|nr:ferritin-like domain-containing protein [Deinococcus taeanensis]UBV42004.1 ferritin-like domain-containing protein [Deinococcus taeanensis]